MRAFALVAGCTLAVQVRAQIHRPVFVSYKLSVGVGRCLNKQRTIMNQTKSVDGLQTWNSCSPKHWTFDFQCARETTTCLLTSPLPCPSSAPACSPSDPRTDRAPGRSGLRSEADHHPWQRCWPDSDQPLGGSCFHTRPSLLLLRLFSSKTSSLRLSKSREACCNAF